MEAWNPGGRSKEKQGRKRMVKFSFYGGGLDKRITGRKKKKDPGGMTPVCVSKSVLCLPSLTFNSKVKSKANAG